MKKILFIIIITILAFYANAQQPSAILNKAYLFPKSINHKNKVIGNCTLMITNDYIEVNSKNFVFKDVIKDFSDIGKKTFIYNTDAGTLYLIVVDDKITYARYNTYIGDSIIFK